MRWYDASISISTSTRIRNLRVNVRHNDADISTSIREWNDFHSLVLVLASYV